MKTKGMFAQVCMIAVVAMTLIFSGGCASMFMSEPTRVDPVEVKYVEAEAGIRNGFMTLEQLGFGELEARGAGAPPGSVISRADYDRVYDTLTDAKRLLRDGRALADAPGSCLDAARFRSLGLDGCLSREQIGVLALAVVTKINTQIGASP